MSPAFPGLTVIALVGLALGRKDGRADPRLRMCAIVGLGCAIVSFLPMAPFYPVLHRMIPLFRAVRVPAHLGQIVLLMIGVIAGFGVASLRRDWPDPDRWFFVSAMLFALVNVEALRSPLG